MLVSRYLLQSDYDKFSNGQTSGLCTLCQNAEEDMSYFMLTCPALSLVRNHVLDQISQLYQNEDVHAPESNEELLSAILNGFYYWACSSNMSEMDETQINYNTDTPVGQHAEYHYHVNRV